MINTSANFNSSYAVKEDNKIVDPINNPDVKKVVPPTPAEADCEIAYEYDYEYKSDKPSIVGLFHGLEDRINRQTLMSGTNIKWDKKRLINGKLAKMQEIGGKPILLETPSNNKISSMYFSAETFFNKIQEMGGKTAELKLNFEHPFFEIAQPAVLNVKTPDGSTVESINSARIPYSPAMEGAFFNQTNFLDFCHRMHLTPVWEDTLEPVQPNTGWNWTSRQKNIMVVSNYYNKKLQTIKNDPAKEIQVAKGDKFEGALSLFSNNFNANVIEFDGSTDINKIKDLLTDLKINKTPMEMVEMNGKIYLIDKSNADLSAILDIADERKLTNNPIFNYETQPLPMPKFENKGAVILSMNQTNSFTQYSHEILTFLLKGVNVLAYDNAGKGLSTGENSESGLKEAVEVCGDYLIQQKGFSQDRIMFKGQCAGGLPSSEAGKTFAKSHVWVDQSPRNFSGVATDVISGFIKEKIEQHKDNFFKKKLFSILDVVSNVISRIITAVSKLILPNFDVVDNLDLNQGAQIYTIGVADSKGQGGDTLVPESHKKEVETYMSHNPNAHYLPMPGATHVTDWWLDPATHTAVNAILADTKLSNEIFLPKQERSDAELVVDHYRRLTGHDFDHRIDPETATDIDGIRYNLLLNVATSNLYKAKLDIEYLEESYSKRSLQRTFRAGLQIAREKKDREMARFFMNKICA